MIVGHHATALASVEVRGTEPREQSSQRRPRALRTSSRDDQRASCRPQQIDGRLHLNRVGRETGSRAATQVLVEQHARGRLGAQGVNRKVQVDRPRLAAFTHRAGHRCVELLQHQRGFAHRTGVARDRTDQIGVHHVLQGSPVFLRARRGTRQHQHRDPGHVGVGDTGHGVGDARTCSHQGHTKSAVQLGLGVRHVDGGPLIAHINDADALCVQAHPDRHDVSAAQPVHTLHAAAAQKTCDHGCRAGVGNG